MDEYVRFQQDHGHTNLTVSECGFYVCKFHPYLGATPARAPFMPEEPFGFLAIKCLYAHCNISPMEAEVKPGFCSSVKASTMQLCLRKKRSSPGSNGHWPLGVGHGVVLFCSLPRASQYSVFHSTRTTGRKFYSQSYKLSMITVLDLKLLAPACTRTSYL